MSNTPPPPPSYPYDPGGGSQGPLPVPQPGWIPGNELPGAAPGQPAPYLPSSLGQPGAGPARSGRPKWLVPAVVLAVVAAVVVGAIVLLGGEDDGGGDALETAAALAALESALADVELPEGTDLVELERCRGFDMGDIAEVAPAGFDAERISAGLEAADVSRLGISSRDPLVVECAAVELPDAYTVLAGPAPNGDYGEFLEENDIVVDPDDVVPFRGGTLHPLCTVDAEGNDICQTLWANRDIQVGLATLGPDADMALTTDWMRAALPGMIAELETLEPGDLVVTG